MILDQPVKPPVSAFIDEELVEVDIQSLPFSGISLDVLFQAFVDGPELLNVLFFHLLRGQATGQAFQRGLNHIEFFDIFEGKTGDLGPFIRGDFHQSLQFELLDHLADHGAADLEAFG
jgi:hypothetical protein